VAIVSRTTNPIHFEDLEPHRFEDLIRQLAYDFRDWQRLEATGRAGSDDGFDVRGLERIAPAVLASPEKANDEDEDPVDAAPDTRLWLIQCKREKAIGPKKLREYVEAFPAEPLYGVIFAAACDFSKQARDEFDAVCRERGYSEVYLWGKAEIEDLLYQPKNDHLLFAYTGISIVARRRSAQSEIRSTIAMRRKLKRVLEKAHMGIVIRNAAGSEYPEPAAVVAGRPRNWVVVPGAELLHDSLCVDLSEFHAHLADDGIHWDAATELLCRRSYAHHGRWPGNRDKTAEYEAAGALWDTWPDKNRAWVYVQGYIPIGKVLAVDDVGDEYFDGPQLYVDFSDPKRGPYSGYSAYVQNIDFNNRVKAHADDATRVKVFPDDLRRL
jgi:hypothetical protein